MPNPGKSHGRPRTLHARRKRGVYLGLSTPCNEGYAAIVTARYKWPLNAIGRVALSWWVPEDPPHSSTVREAIIEATKAWEDATNQWVNYREQRDNNADVVVRVGRIDGSGKVLAYNYFPPVDGQSAQAIHGDMLVDTSTMQELALAGLITCVTHELGHGIGLTHGDKGLMAPYYSGQPRQKPDAAAVERVVQLYWPERGVADIVPPKPCTGWRKLFGRCK